MNRLQLFRILRRHVGLSEKRSLAFEQNRVAKFVAYLLGSFMVVYMMMISVTLAMVANDLSEFTSYEFIYALLPFILLLDFFFRFIGQHTPSQLVKPYMLLPMPKYVCVECFVLTSMASLNNLLWLLITVPYAIMTMLFSEGIAYSVAFVVTFQLIIVINSLWYMTVRTLLGASIFWWLLPAAVYAAVFSPWYLSDIDCFFDLFSSLGGSFAGYSVAAYVSLAAVMAALFFVNREMQYRFTYMESNNTETVKMNRVTQLHAFDRFGRQGEYLKLEVKSIMRNKNMRRSFVFSVCFITVLSLLISFTDVYETGSFSMDFWIVYVFILYGSTTLIKIMGAEGNYLDGLMVHKENIFSLLKAKYYFYSAMLLLPLILMLPTVVVGRCTLLMLLSMLLFTAGPAYCLLMQMAVYNKQTVPLNTKFVSKGNMETNYFQIVAEMIVMFLPVVLISALKALFDETTAYVVLMVSGLVFIIFHNYWIRNIYKRFMARRHENMEAFRYTK